jgi:hypothetical protein
MLSRYFHVRMEAKLQALDEIAARQLTADERREAVLARRHVAASTKQTLPVQ